MGQLAAGGFGPIISIRDGMHAQARVCERGVGGSSAEPMAAASNGRSGTGAHGLWPEQRHCRGWAV